MTDKINQFTAILSPLLSAPAGKMFETIVT